MSAAIDARPCRERVALVGLDAAGRESAVVLESQDQTVTGQGGVSQKKFNRWTTVSGRVVASAGDVLYQSRRLRKTARTQASRKQNRSSNPL